MFENEVAGPQCLSYYVTVWLTHILEGPKQLHLISTIYQIIIIKKSLINSLFSLKKQRYSKIKRMFRQPLVDHAMDLRWICLTVLLQ